MSIINFVEGLAVAVSDDWLFSRHKISTIIADGLMDSVYESGGN